MNLHPAIQPLLHEKTKNIKSFLKQSKQMIQHRDKELKERFSSFSHYNTFDDLYWDTKYYILIINNSDIYLFDNQFALFGFLETKYKEHVLNSNVEQVKELIRKETKIYILLRTTYNKFSSYPLDNLKHFMSGWVKKNVGVDLSFVPVFSIDCFNYV
ncbi:MAG: hypothetical protein N2043_01770 [Ignavibacterium sp.]|nr:hypothetical protein [Ignavibacterium sp.]